MDYKEFCEHIKEEIKGFMPEQYASYEPQLHTVSKPNVGERVGLTFVPPVSGTPTPVIYLEPYYDGYLDRGMSVGRLMTQIADTAVEGIEKGRSASGGMFDLVPDMTNWEKIKDKVTVRVIGVSRNTELLKEVPCRLFGDIALIYQVSVKAPDDIMRRTNTGYLCEYCMERRFLLRPRMRRNRNKATVHMMMAKEKPQKYEYTKVICIFADGFFHA